MKLVELGQKLLLEGIKVLKDGLSIRVNEFHDADTSVFDVAFLDTIFSALKILSTRFF